MIQESRFQDMKKLYSHEFVAKKMWVCYGCLSIIKKAEKYHKVRVNAHLPYSNATRLKPLCIDCSEEFVLKRPANQIVSG